ncbi:MAG: YpdA family putative bacillithiol disulfide reductase [Saprospiraceae bacterium]|nr:YpdA family putative bacillithiol disulfide reductase [Candidatus Opimibacter iunctus]
MHDLIIIGAGPIGLTCAIEAKRTGLDALIIDKGMLVNTLFHFPTNMTFFSTSLLLEIGDVPFVSHDEKPTRRESLEYYRRVYESWNLNAHFYETVVDVQKHPGHFEVLTDKSSYTSKSVVVATGFYDLPVLMNVPGEDLPKVLHYYDEPHPYVDQRVAVIGAANSACDVALELWHKGAAVTMIIRESVISDRVKYWIKPNIENRIREGSIKAWFNSSVSAITPGTIEITTPDGPISLPNDFVMAMTGYQPDFKWLEKIGIQLTNQPDTEIVYNPDTHETNVPGLFVAGVVCGGMCTNKFFIENARDHADKIIRNVFTKRNFADAQAQT